MGLFRLFWIPRGGGPGAYVRYPAADLLGILALESRRSGAFIVGEDLGTVEQGTREALAACGILSSRVLWFEEQPPSCYPHRTLAAVTTHDLPTVAGLWTGADLNAQRKIGLDPSGEAADRMRGRLREQAGLEPGACAPDAVLAAYELLAQAPSMALLATLDDALAVEERPNMPGTTSEWPNWCLALPRTIEEIENELLPRRLAATLNRR
jgi:4-alpha-glucanotransferase